MVKRGLQGWVFFFCLVLSSNMLHAYVPDVGEGVCVYNCDVPSYSSSSSSSYDSAYYNAVGQATYTIFNQLGQSLVQSWTEAAAAQARAAAEARARRQQALNYNDQGNHYFESGDWANAVSAYGSALGYSPNDKNIQDNLRRARAYQVASKGIERHEQDDWQGALEYYYQALEIAPENRKIRKYIRLARAMQSRDAAMRAEDGLIKEMREVSSQLQSQMEVVASELELETLSAEQRAARLEIMRRLGTKGVRFKDDIPVPKPQKQPLPYQIKKDQDRPGLYPYIDFANKGLQKWAETKQWGAGKYQEIKDLIRGEVQNRLPGGQLKNFKEGVEGLKEKIGNEHKKTGEGLFGHMRHGVEEAGRPDIQGDTDEKIDSFIQERGKGYQDMARQITEEKIKGSIQPMPGSTDAATSAPPSSTSPILGKKSYAVERAAALSKK